MNINDVKQEIKASGLTLAQISDGTGLSKSWLYKTFADNDSYSLKNPSEAKLKLIIRFCDGYARFVTKFK